MTIDQRNAKTSKLNWAVCSLAFAGVTLLGACGLAYGRAPAEANARSRCLSTNMHGQKGILACNDAIDRNPKDHELWNARGYEWIGEGRLDQAIADFSEAIALNAGYAEAYYNRGRARELRKDFQGALDDFDRFIQLEPSDPDGPKSKNRVTAETGSKSIASPKSYEPPTHQGRLSSDRVADRFPDAVASHNRGDQATAIQTFRSLAEQGDAKAQLMLGVFYLDGNRGLPKDLEQAALWVGRAADQGDATAQGLMGAMHAQGNGVPQDYGKAMLWFRKAADQGNALAQESIGRLYAEGDGVAQDYEQAAVWYHKAAERGVATAQNTLGEMYVEGRGVSEDYDQAVLWFSRAAAQGDDTAQSNLGALYWFGKHDADLASLWLRRSAEQGNAKAAKLLAEIATKTDKKRNVK